MPDDLLRALMDPTAPLPAGWPSGSLGAFLLFLVPVGGGIPAGVLMARDGGASPPLTALLYFASDIVLALTAEPLLWLALCGARWFPLLARLGQRLGRLSSSVGLRDSGSRGPLGLIMVSFTISPTTGRAAAAAAGHGFLPGWSLAIAGDMLYFGLLMVSTLWVSSVLGDERLTIGVVFVAMLCVPMLLRRLKRRTTAGVGAAQLTGAVAVELAGSSSGGVELAGREMAASVAAAARRRARGAGRGGSRRRRH